MMQNAQISWTIDPTHSMIEFAVKHLGVSWVKGRFTKVEGKAQFDHDNPAKGSVEASIKTASIWTGDEGRDRHLRSADFFDAEHHPAITFKSTGIEKAGGQEYKISGNLTMRGVTRPVVLVALFLGVRKIPSGEGKEPSVVAGVSAKTVLNRHDFNISWDMPSGEGVTAVAGEVEVNLDIRLQKQ